jgi:hypothetical protein
MGRENSTRRHTQLIRLIFLQINFFWDRPLRIPIHFVPVYDQAMLAQPDYNPLIVMARPRTVRFPPTILLLFCLLIGLHGCAGQEIQRKDGLKSVRGFSSANLVKSDIDMMAEMNQSAAIKSLKLLSDKLYRRNPQEFRKSGMDSAEAASARIFSQIPHWANASLPPPDWEAQFNLAFLEGYSGDRVQAFITALTSMVMASYDYKTALFLHDALSAQKLYNSARNVEVAVWKLSNAKHPGGAKVLISNSMDGEAANLSFEREFGKLIALQDLLAVVVEDKSNRSISRVFQNVATFIFLPI